MSTYLDAILDFRRRKDEHFQAGRGPVNPAEFQGLSYYPPDARWAFTVPLDPAPTPDPAEAEAAGALPGLTVLETNTGEPRQMQLLGLVRFSLPGGERRLSVFAPLGEERPGRVFIPFRDASSGQDTYGAGRYLDAPVTWEEGGEAWVNLDFNLAYHPYCAYSDGWTCPLPPPGNVLPEAVTAGERLPPPSPPPPSAAS